MTNHSSFFRFLRLAMVLSISVAATFATANAATDSKAAFARIKSLKGNWSGPVMMGKKMTANFKVIANGTAVLATFFPNTSMEMITVYYPVGEKLVLTHYCMLGNQPRMKLDLKKSSADTLVFEFAGGDNIKSTKMNMHGETIRFVSKNKIESTCVSQERGKPECSHTSVLVRKN